MRAVIAVPAPMAAEATTASVSLRVRLTANMDATLHLLFQEVGGLSALDNAELQAASPEFRTFEINAPLEVSASAVTPSQKIDVRMTILARDNYNHLTAVNAMLDVELEGAILYIDPAGNERKDVPSRIVRIPSEGLDVLRTVRLTSDADAELTLTVSELNFSSGVAEAASVTVSVRAASRQLRTLLIDASSTVTVGAEAEDVDVSIRGRDNYGDPIAVSGMLTAVLDGDAVFVDEDGKERTRAVIAVPASMEAATASVSLSLRVRLTAAMDATLHLSFQAGGLSSELVSVRLQAAPGRLSRLLIEAPASAPLMQGRPQIVNVPVRALDGYGVGWREAVEVNFHAALESGAVFVDEAGMAVGNVVTSTLLIGAGGSSTGSLRVRLDSDFGVTLRMTIATDHLSAEAEMELTLMVSTFRADMCAALDIAAMDCARLAAAFTSGGEGPVAGGVAGDDSNLGWSTAVTATAVGGSALASPAIADDQHSCLGFAIRLDEPEALSFDWRVSSQAGDSLRLWVDGGSGAMDVIDGDSGQWRRHSRELGVGDHRIRWCYQKNAAGAGGSDAAWLDNMRINPLKILVVSIDGTTAQTLTQPQPFKTASATLKLRLLDGFRNPLPLSNLASDFPLQIKVIAPQGAQAYWSPRTIEFSQIAGDALFHRVDLSVSPPSNDGTALRIFVETAQLNVSNSLSLKPASPLEFRRTFCDAVGASDADCELITSVESRGDTPWFIDDAGLLRSGEVDGSRRSCLHVFAALPDARTLDFDISIVTEEALIDTLTFELNGDQKAKIPAVDDIFNLGEPVDFAYQGELEAGEAELSWCYEDAYDFAGDDAGVLRAMRFIKLARLEVVTAPRLELSPEGHPATLHLSLGAYDNYGEFWPRPLTTTLVATLNEGAVFVDDDGDAGDVVTSMILLNSVEEMHSLHLRLSAAHAVTLTLTLEGGGLTMQTTVGLEVRSEFQSAMCQALDVSETDCARFANFFTAGGDGPVMAGRVGDDESVAWSEVVDRDAVGASALRSDAIADDRHSCLGFDIHLIRGETLAFDWRVSSRSGDALRLWIDGDSGAGDAIDGDSGEWRAQSRALTTGERSIRWCYEKDATGEDGSDAAWLDNVRMELMKPSTLILDYAGAAAGSALRHAEAFKPVTATLTLRLLDQFRRPLPLSSLSESNFPLQIKTSFRQGAQAFWNPRQVDYSQIAPDALLHRIDLTVSAPLSDDATLRIVAETAELGEVALVSNPLSLQPPTSRELRQTFCAAVGLDEADCAFVADIRSSGAAPWHIDDGGILRSGVIGSPERYFEPRVQSCLHVRVKLAETSVLDFSMGVSSEANADPLIFRWYGVERRRISGVFAQGRTFSHREELPSGDAELSWCYEKDFNATNGLDAGWLQSLRFLKIEKLGIATRPSVDLSSDGVPALIDLSLRAFDSLGDVWTPRFAATVRAELIGEAAFVDFDGNVASEMILTAVGEVNSLFRVRLSGDAAATLKLTAEVGGGAAPASATVSLQPRSELNADMCRALDISEANCVRFENMFSSGGQGAVTAGIVGSDARLSWSTGDDASAVGASALKSHSIAGSQHTCLGFDVRLHRTEVLLFDWRVSSQVGDLLRLWIDGENRDADAIDGDSGAWRQLSRQLAAGEHRIRWCYEKNASGQAGADAAWLDNVRLGPLNPALILTRADATSASPPAPFKMTTATLTLSLIDQFELPLPLASLGAQSFPLQIKMTVQEGAQVIYGPASISFAEISGNDSSYEINLNAYPPVSDDQIPARVFVATAESADLALASNSLPLRPAPFSEYRRAFCQAVALSDDCALITGIHFSGAAPWYLDDEGSLRNGEIGSRQKSCLHVSARLPEPKVLNLDMSIFSRFNDSLTFTLNDVETASENGDPSEIKNFSHQEMLPAGEVEFSWCYNESRGSGREEDVSRLRRLRFIELNRFVITTPLIELSRQGAPVEMPVSIEALDNDGELWTIGFAATLAAELNDKGVFVDGEGDAGSRVTSSISVQSGFSRATTPLRLRLLGAESATLTLTVTAAGVTPTVVSLKLSSAPENGARMCSALDISEANCMRFTGLFTAGGDAGVTGGIVGDDGGLVWSVVSTATATGGSALVTNIQIILRFFYKLSYKVYN